MLEWTDEEANTWFKRIEESNGKNETEIIDWKETLYLQDTGFNNNKDTNNTTQRAMAGFANTLGGTLVLGFNKNGELVGIQEKDIENKISTSFNNRKNTNLNKIKYQVRYYTYKDNTVIVVFIDKSKEPIQCDNGVFYYRQQSQFLALPYFKLENKFREYLDDEKYLYLVTTELDRINTYISFKIKSIGDQNTLSIKLDHYSNYIKTSGEKLYFLYKKHNLLEKYAILIKNIDSLIAKQRSELICPAELRTLGGNIKEFYDLLNNIEQM